MAAKSSPNADSHPLENNRKWKFFQPYMYGQFQIALKEKGKEEWGKQTLTISNHWCREFLVSYVRRVLLPELQRSPDAELNLNLPSVIFMRAASGEGVAKLSEPQLRDLIQLMDTIAGVPCLLLSPGRLPGEWWRTAIKVEGEYIQWKGTDSSIIFSPALLSFSTGLLRQANLLFHAGVEKEVFDAAPYEEVCRVLTEADRAGARALVEKLRPWIQVPIPLNASIENFSVPWYKRTAKQISYWQRFIRLCNALESHSLSEVFEGDARQCWTDEAVKGAWSFWGEGIQTEGKKNSYHARLMKLGARSKE